MGAGCFLVFISLTIASVYSYSEPRRCDVIGKGASMCGDYLTGYYECDGTNSYGRFRACDPEEMCSCGLNKKCAGNGKNVCIKRPSIPKVPTNFIVSYQGDVKTNSPHGSKSETFHGIALQDLSEKNNEKILKRMVYFKDGDRVKTITKLTIKSKSYYTQYTLFQLKDGTSHCQRSPIYQFKDLFHDLRLLSYKESTNNYEYRDGPLHVGDRSLIQKWTFSRLHHTQFAPKYYVRNETGSQHSRASNLLRIQFRYFYEHRPHSSYFRVPASCASKQDPAADETEQLFDDEIDSLDSKLMKDLIEEDDKRELEDEELEELLNDN